MTRSKLIENLKTNIELSDKSWVRFEPLAYAVCLLVLVGKSFLDLSGIVPDLLSVSLVLIMLWLLFKKSPNEKIDKETDMYCQNCEVRFEQETLAYAVLVNECQNCKNPIYET